MKTDDPKKIRDWARGGGLRRPHCGAHLYVNIYGATERDRDAMLEAEAEFERAGGLKQLIGVEDAEDYARKHGLETIE